MTIAQSGQPVAYSGPDRTKVHESINVDHAVQIDAHDPDEVIRIKHSVGDGVDVIDAIDIATNATTFKVSSTGAVSAPDITLGAPVGSVHAMLAAATHIDDGVANKLIKRNQATGTEVDNFHVVANPANYTEDFPPPGLYFTQGVCDESLDLLEDGQLSFVPYDAQGDLITGRHFVFGRAQPVLGETFAQTDHSRDGLTISDENVSHSVEICCNNAIPTLQIVGSKQTTTTNGATRPVCPV